MWYDLLLCRGFHPDVLIGVVRLQSDTPKGLFDGSKLIGDNRIIDLYYQCDESHYVYFCMVRRAHIVPHA